MSIDTLDHPSSPEEAERLEREKKYREKTVAYFLAKEAAGSDGEADLEVTDETTKRIGDKLDSGEIGILAKKKLMMGVKGPMDLHGEKAVYDGDSRRGYVGIKGRFREEFIMSSAVKVPMEKMSFFYLAQFQNEYPTPLDFERKAEEMLEVMKGSVSPEEYGKFEEAMDSFQRKVYGEKYEYYLAIKSLAAEARERATIPPFAGDMPEMTPPEGGGGHSPEGHDADDHGTPRRVVDDGAGHADRLVRRVVVGSEEADGMSDDDDEEEDRPLRRVVVDESKEAPAVVAKPEAHDDDEEVEPEISGPRRLRRVVETSTRSAEGIVPVLTIEDKPVREELLVRSVDEVPTIDFPEEDRVPRRRVRSERLRMRMEKDGFLTPEEGREIVGRSTIEGDELLVENGDKLEPKTLSREDLLEAELEPTHEMELEGVKFGFSEVFLVDDRREAVIGYVEKDGKVYARSYYRSGPSAMWRYLPDRVQDKATGEITWLGGGHSDESLILPSEVQAALNAQSMSTEKKQTADMTDGEKRVSGLRKAAFYGTAKALPRRMTRGRNPDAFNDALSREVDDRPVFRFLDDVTPGTLMPIRDSHWPDYGKEVGRFAGESEVYGHFTARTYESEDGGMRWTILEDERGQAWVGQIETSSPITSTGLRKSWIDSGDFCRPLYDFAARESSVTYGDKSDVKMGVDAETGKPYVRYVSMWKNYLSKVAVIQEYKAHRDKE